MNRSANSLLSFDMRRRNAEAAIKYAHKEWHTRKGRLTPQAAERTHVTLNAPTPAFLRAHLN